jgi:hypothetical protein
VLISCFHVCCSIQSEDEVSDDGDYDADAAETAAEGPVVRPVDEELEGVKGLRRESSRRTAADDEEQSGSESEGEQGDEMETQQQVRFGTVVLCTRWCRWVTSLQQYGGRKLCAVCTLYCSAGQPLQIRTDKMWLFIRVAPYVSADGRRDPGPGHS